MPIYKPEEYDAVLARIKQGVREQDIPMDPVLSEEQVRAFEQKHQITLPEGYRRFLLEVGGGCYMFDDYPSYQLLPLEADRPAENYAAPFPFTEYVIEGDEPLSDEFWEQLQRSPLIITGPCRGEVWSLCEMGTQPCCQRQDFLGWFERWLTDGDNVDYYAEFPY